MSDEASRKRLLEKYRENTKNQIHDILEKTARSPLMVALMVSILLSLFVDILVSAILPESEFFSDVSFNGIVNSLDLILRWALNLTLALGLFWVWICAGSHRGPITPGLQMVRIVLSVYRYFVILIVIIIAGMGLMATIGIGPLGFLLILLVLGIAGFAVWLPLKFFSRLIQFLDTAVGGTVPHGSEKKPDAKGLDNWLMGFGILFAVIALAPLLLPKQVTDVYSLATDPGLSWIPGILSSIAFFLGVGLFRQYSNSLTATHESAFLQRMK